MALHARAFQSSIDLVASVIRDASPSVNIVVGVNDGEYDPATNDIVTAASCTTNCLAPVVKVIHESIGIRHGSITTLHDMTKKFDRSVESIAWAPSSRAIYFTAEDFGQAPVYVLESADPEPVELARVHADDLAFAPDGKRLFFSRTTVAMPSEIASLDLPARPAKEAQPMGTESARGRLQQGRPRGGVASIRGKA